MAAPRDTPGLQLSYDLVGDFGVKARTIIAVTNSCGASGHRGSPRRAPEASLPNFNPSRQIQSALSLSTAVTLHGPRGKRTLLCARMEARRVKTREAGLQRSRQPSPAGRRRQATQVLVGASAWRRLKGTDCPGERLNQLARGSKPNGCRDAPSAQARPVQSLRESCRLDILRAVEWRTVIVGMLALRHDTELVLRVFPRSVPITLVHNSP